MLMRGTPLDMEDVDRIEIGISEENDLLSGKTQRSPVTFAIEAINAGYHVSDAENLGLMWEDLDRIDRDFIDHVSLATTAGDLKDMWRSFQLLELIPRDIPVPEMADIDYKTYLIRDAIKQLRKILIHAVYEVF